MKEIETMKWESANWRRAEIEVSGNSMVAGFYHSFATDKSPFVELRFLNALKEAKDLTIVSFFFGH